MVLVRKKKRKNRVCLDVVVSCQVMNGNCGDDSGLNYKLGRISGKSGFVCSIFFCFFLDFREISFCCCCFRETQRKKFKFS